MHMKLRTVAVLIALLALSGTPICANILTNGSFETGDFTGWAVAANATGVNASGFDGYAPQDGQYFAALGPVGGEGSMSQTFSDTAGEYVLTFFIASHGDSNSNFSAYWNGNQLMSVVTPDSGRAYVQYQFAVTGTGNDTVSFLFRDDPAYIALDNVSVDQVVPEPTSFFFIGGGLIGLAIRLRRR